VNSPDGLWLSSLPIPKTRWCKSGIVSAASRGERDSSSGAGAGRRVMPVTTRHILGSSAISLFGAGARAENKIDCGASQSLELGIVFMLTDSCQPTVEDVSRQ
jgi:hypothetical protein